jgi:hypothetical protein
MIDVLPGRYSHVACSALWRFAIKIIIGGYAASDVLWDDI